MNQPNQVSNVSSLNNDINYDYNFGNYNPNDVEVEETINAVFVIDTSSSVNAYAQELNNALNEFIQRMQKSHAADKLFVSQIEFNSKINVVHGFKPIGELQPVDLTSRIGGTTALYKATEVALQNALAYRKDLENSGVNCKTLLFVLTDGGNNEPGDAAAVKAIIDTLMQTDERNFFSFESILFGIGNDTEFEAAQKDMGISHLARVGTTADEIRKMIAFISSSITSVSTGGGVSAPNF
jgi:uncharacterized protein YegL